MRDLGAGLRRGGCVALLAIALLAAGCKDATKNAGTPTVVLVTIDTLRADRVGCYGRANAGTPTLDRLAAEGTRFAAAEATAPLTLPAHSSIMTGRTIAAHGVLNNGTFALADELTTIAERFQAAGYATGAFVSSKVLAQALGLTQGFDRYDDQIVSNEHPGGGPQLHFADRQGRETVDRAIAWLLSQPGKPAFLWIHLWEPHAPYQPPEPYRSQFPHDRYQGEIATADAALGRLLDGIGSLEGPRNVLTVAMSDHGEGLGEHGEATHGVYLYQPMIHVPLIVHGPAWGVREGVVREPVSHVDIAPTLLALAALPALEYTDGVSLADVLKDGADVPEREGVMAESHLPQIEFGWSGLRAIVKGDTKIIDAPRPELYDLADDPGESRDLAAQRAGELAAARADMDGMQRRASAAAAAISAARSMSAEEIAQLQGLGYVSSGRGRAGDRPLVDPMAPDPKDRAEFLGRLDKAMAHTQYDRAAEAVTILRELAAEEPNNIAMLLQFGQSLIITGQHEEALDVFRRCVTLDPTFGLAWHRIGQLLDARKDLAGAEHAYRTALEHDPYNVLTYKALAGNLIDQAKLRDAIGVLERAQKVEPTDESIGRDIQFVRSKLK
ncbi:MAG: sulfatase-like hydrolase/transferase [Acidobacteria bacterium]|nr:sulfatase-like hydrolase/transferase [Acidobacteriota bacterium]